jgi:hypothetical protein
MTKKCNKCKKIKDVSKFHTRKQKASIGYRYICKVCDNKAVLARRKKTGWINEKKRQGPGSKHSIASKVTSQKHRTKMSSMYIRSLMTKKSKSLNPEDIPDELVVAYRENLKLKRKLKLTPKLKGEEDKP